MQILLEHYFKFINVPENKKKRLATILSYCKEIRNTAYPLPNSKVTELELVEFTAYRTDNKKDKNLYCFNGSLSLNDGNRTENRVFDAYIFLNDEEGKVRVYMDVTRLNNPLKPKMIRTSEEFIFDKDNVLAITAYSSPLTNEEKTFTEEFPRKDQEDNYLENRIKQLYAF